MLIAWVADCCIEEMKSEDSSLQPIEFKFKEESSDALHVEQTIVWCWNFDTLKSISEIRWKFWNVVLEKEAEDQ